MVLQESQANIASPAIHNHSAAASGAGISLMLIIKQGWHTSPSLVSMLAVQSC